MALLPLLRRGNSADVGHLDASMKTCNDDSSSRLSHVRLYLSLSLKEEEKKKKRVYQGDEAINLTKRIAETLHSGVF